jgi:hypothetical protein
MEVIADCTVFFLDILPCTLPPTGFSPFLALSAGNREKKKVVIKFLELSLSTHPREFKYLEYLYSNSTHDKPTLYSTQLI